MKTTGTISIHRMLKPWKTNSTWNTLDQGVTADNSEAAGDPDDKMTDIKAGQFYEFDVTRSLQIWQKSDS